MLFKPVPILSILLVIIGIIIWVMEWPLVMTDYFTSPASFVLKIALYVPMTVLALLSSQTNNGGIYMGIGIFGYVMALRDDFKRQQQSWNRLA
ncbi:hypothetical protein BGW42_008738 [Actinomortierella wolfii]|nr:hypothetical protein BGW42_008738 [Actinomortierella wolfii]